MPEQNYHQTLSPDFCIIGGGAGGIDLAKKLAKSGFQILILEKERMGGDCLFHGCIPSKTLIATAQCWHTILKAKPYDPHSQNLMEEFSKVSARIERTTETIATALEAELTRLKNVTVIQGTAKFINPHTVCVENIHIHAKRFVIATGSSPYIPPIQGLGHVPYLTNESIFKLKEKPKSLIVVGGGPVGVEIAQSFLRFGTHVTLIQSSTILSKDDPELVNELKADLMHEGMVILEHARLNQLSPHSEGVLARVTMDGANRDITAQHVLIATGRKANHENLGLCSAHIDSTEKGIVVNRYMLTTNRAVYALGDVTGQYQLTHAAQAEADIIFSHATGKMRPKFRLQLIPWITYTDPEFAHAGFTQEQLKGLGKKFVTIRVPFSAIDRAHALGETKGSLKAILSPAGKILGVTIYGHGAGELISPWGLAMQCHLGIKSFAEQVTPYPTLSEIHKHAAIAFSKQKPSAPLWAFTERCLFQLKVLFSQVKALLRDGPTPVRKTSSQTDLNS